MKLNVMRFEYSHITRDIEIISASGVFWIPEIREMNWFLTKKNSFMWLREDKKDGWLS